MVDDARRKEEIIEKYRQRKEKAKIQQKRFPDLEARVKILEDKAG